VRSVTYRRAAMARLDMPSAISPRTSRSRWLSWPSGSWRRRRPTRRETMVGRSPFAVHDAAQGVDHDGDAEYALLGE
jgi:hypothetical protein